MSDEEKKAIDYLQLCYDLSTITNESLSKLGIVLNLIEKQSKEIEELKEDNKHQWEERCKLTFELENSTSNDKIKAKIDELDKQEEDLQNSISNEEREEYSDANISWELMDIQIRREVLQSLLEKE